MTTMVRCGASAPRESLGAATSVLAPATSVACSTRRLVQFRLIWTSLRLPPSDSNLAIQYPDMIVVMAPHPLTRKRASARRARGHDRGKNRRSPSHESPLTPDARCAHQLRHLSDCIRR